MKKLTDYRKIDYLRDHIIIEKVYPLSILEGIQKGEIFVDDDEAPNVALVWHYCGFANILGNYNERFIEEAMELMQNPPEGHSGRMALQTENDSRLEDMILRTPMVARHERYIFEFVSERGSIPHSMETKLKEITVDNYELLKGRIIPTFSWPNKEEFFKNGFGYCLIEDDQMLACAFASGVSKEYVDIGVETAEECRGKGYGRIVAAAMVKEILRRGKTPVWDCDIRNEASMRLACSVGFEIVGTHPWYKCEESDRAFLSAYQREFLSRIISIPSVGGLPEEGAPYGAEPRKVLQIFLDEAREKGFRTGIEGERVGWAEFGEGERLIGIICHLDVVPVGNGWDSDPFTLTIRADAAGQESLYARGIVDDKGPACASFFAMLELKEENRIPQDYRVRLILGSDEERGCSCIQYYARHAEIPDFSITPDSIFPVIYCEKGILQLKISGENKNDLKAHGGSAVNIVPASASCDLSDNTITAKGKAAHASKPELGINAIELLAKAMEDKGINLKDYPVMRFVRDFDIVGFTGCDTSSDYGDLTYNIGLLNADEKGCELWIDFRIPYGIEHEAFIEKLSKKGAEYGLKTEVKINMSPLLKDKKSPEVSQLTKIWKRHIDKFTGFKEEYRNIHTEPKTVGVGTYARHIPNTIAFGIQAPWLQDQCHQANEHVAVTDYLQWIQIIKEFIPEVGGHLCKVHK